MRQIYGEELKKIQLNILDTVAAFCDKHGISYWISNGTLLGAIRHKGYIPWDDDIDIGMLRPDYIKFKNLFNKENDRYQFFCVDNNDEFLYPYGKVLDTTTVLYEPNKNGNKLSINIDVFVYDNVPDEKEAKKMYDIRDFCRRLHVQRIFKDKANGNLIKKAATYCVRVSLKVFPRNYFVKKLSRNAQKFASQETQYIGNFTSYSRIICDKNVFSNFIMAEFEGRVYRIPEGYDTFLRCFYGDYMKLPPVEKRVSHHQFEAYIND